MPNSSNDFFSVVLSTFNQDKYLTESIDSIVAQTLWPSEIIIIDDGSTDDTPKLLQKYLNKIPGFHVITHSQNVGLTASLNQGINLSKAQFIARLDADDIWLPQKLEKQYQFLDKHPKTTVLGTFTQNINHQGYETSKTEFPTQDLEVRNSLKLQNCLAHSSVVFNRAPVQASGNYDITYKSAQDYELWLRLARDPNNIFANLPQYLVKKRIISSNISAKQWKQQKKFALRAIKQHVLSQKPSFIILLNYLFWQLILRVAPSNLKTLKRKFIR